MQKSVVILLAVVLAVLAIASNVGSAEKENVTVYFEYRTDDNGYNYGVDFYADSTVSTSVYVVPYIASHDNVTGAVVSGTVSMNAYEKRVRIGSFIAVDRDKPWSVDVGARWERQ